MAEAPQEHPLALERVGAVARLRLDRPALHNAFDAGLISALTAALDQLADDPEVRVVVLEGSGASFSAGADLNWMRGMASARSPVTPVSRSNHTVSASNEASNPAGSGHNPVNATCGSRE